MTVSEDVEGPDLTESLPDELIINIFKLLPLETVLTCEKVCSRWRKLARDPAVWRGIVIIYTGQLKDSEEIEKRLEIIETHSECIRCLKIQYVYNYSLIKSLINQCPNLISLELVMCRIEQEFGENVTRWTKLKKLSLKNSLALLSNKDEDVKIDFDNFKYLECLCLSDFGLPTISRDSLLHCHHLSTIFIDKIKNLDLDYVKNLIISKMEIITTLHIYGGYSVNDECLFMLSQCKNLKDLAIIRCENLTDAGLVNLANLKNLNYLQIWNNVNFSEAALHGLLSSPNMVKLQSLSLSRIGNISPMIVDVISEYYKNLKFLTVYQCPRIINTDYERQLKSKFRNIDVVLF